MQAELTELDEARVKESDDRHVRKIIDEVMDQRFAKERLEHAQTNRQKALQFFKDFTAPTIAVAVLLFVWTQWGDYREFRGTTKTGMENLVKTTERIEGNLKTFQDDVTKQFLSLRLQNASNQADNPVNQREAQAVLLEANQKSIYLPIDVVKDSGEKFIRAAAQQPGAWDAALLLANHRSTLNINLTRTPTDAETIVAEVTNYTFKSPTGRPVIKLRAEKNPGAPIENAARMEPILRPTNTTVKTGDTKLVARGGAFILDGIRLKHVVFEGVEIYYSGREPVIMEDVVFVNCTFVLSNTVVVRKFSEQLLADLTLNFDSSIG